MEKQIEKPQATAEKTPKPRRPDDTGAVSATASLKIFDPKTRKVYVEQQA